MTLYLCTCMYVGMWYMYVCLHKCIYTYTYMCIYMYVYAHACNVYICTVCSVITCMYIHKYVHTYMHMCAHISRIYVRFYSTNLIFWRYTDCTREIEYR